jgi:[ribosomal protein S5]-alanine N-acetyltransferase
VTVRDAYAVGALVPPTLDAGDCWLRPWTVDDAPALRTACGDDEICRFTTVPRVYSRAAAVQWIERVRDRAARGDAIVLAIVPAREPTPVGMVGLFGLDEPGQTARFGYWLIAQARRRGLATRALRDWAFSSLALETIFIDREPSNPASARVADRLGATLAGSRRVVVTGSEIELARHALPRPSAR